jgi:flagellar motor switch protein FliG
MKIDGFKEALELLKNLDTESRQRIMMDMAKQNPELVEQLKSHLVSFDDLIYMTASMMRDLLAVVDPLTLGISLRTEDPKIAIKLKSLMSKNNADELEEGMSQGLKPLSEVQKIQSEVMDKINTLVSQGKIVLSADGEEYV